MRSKAVVTDQPSTFRAGGTGPSSDPRTAFALEALRGPRERFDSAVTDAAERLRALIDSVREPGNGTTARASAELGSFASHHIDVTRFAGVFAAGESIPPAAQARIVAAHQVLSGLVHEGVAPHIVRLKRGEDLCMEVGYTLARAGRVFGAARAATRARTGTGSLGDEALLAAYAFRDWNRAEKSIAPPLVVELEGGDLRASGLVDFLDGRMKLVLVARGEAPVAALAETISPKVFVAQARFAPDAPTASGDAARSAEVGALLRRLAEYDGPGVVGLIANECAEFVHDPTLPERERLSIATLPVIATQAVGYVTAFRQAESVGLLALLAAGQSRLAGGNGRKPVDALATKDEAAAGPGAVAAAGTPSAGVATAPVEPADKLAAWLLQQADVPAPGGIQPTADG